MDFAIAGQAFDRPSRLRVAVIIDLVLRLLIVRHVVAVAVGSPNGIQRSVRRIENDARACDESLLELLLLGRREGILVFRGAPSDEKLIGVATETCLRGQLDFTAFRDIAHLRWRRSAASVKIVDERVRFQRIGHAIVVFVIAPGSVDCLVSSSKGDFGNRSRRLIGTAEN